MIEQGNISPRVSVSAEKHTSDYYDEFSAGYERHRRPNEPDGYHALIDDLEIALVARYGKGRDVLECGCGTGLVLQKIAALARHAQGIDLSVGMLKLAEKRGLDVQKGTVTALPFESETFDVTCAFKVLAHVPDIARALSEMVRVTRSGGFILAEFYNPLSLRGMIKKWGPAGKISQRTKEDAVYTRFDPPWIVPRLLPPQARLVGSYGVRIVTPSADAMRIPILRGLLRNIEMRLAPTRAAYAAGFYVAILRKGPFVDDNDTV